MINVMKEFIFDTPSLGPLDTLINIVLAGLMAYLIRTVYIKFSTALSNRKHFANTFMLITVCTTLIIALIQSSIALSLGLVGALSIIRFRTAIKEPQELSYIFLCIAMGLGFGANQRILTFSAGFLILAIIVLTGFFKSNKVEEAYNLTLKTKSIELDNIIKIASQFCKRADLRRFDETPNGLSVILFAEFKEYEKLKSFVDKLKEIDKDIQINFVSTRTLG